MKPHVLTEGDRQVLSELGRYRLLTIDQMLRLRLPGATDRKHVGSRFSKLVEAGYIDRARGSAQAPFVHWLTPKAAKHYGEALGSEWATAASKRGFSAGAYMPARLQTVDVCIAARLWADRTGGQVQSLKLDFHAGGTLKATTIEAKGYRYTPDAICDLIDAEGEPWTFALEVETGGFSDRLDNFADKLAARLDVMRHHVIDHGLARPKGRRAARMLFVFATPDLLAAALKLAAKTDLDDKAWRSIYLQALPNVLEDFAGPWFQADGRTWSPFVGRPSTNQ